VSEGRVVRVELDARGYDIHIGAGLIARAGTHLAPLAKGGRVVLVTDKTVAGLHLPALEQSLDRAGIPHAAVILPPGEGTKDFAHFATLCEEVLALGVERQTLMVAGGAAPSPHARNFDVSHLPRIQAVERDLDYWLTYFDRNPGERYVSDGDATTITVASGSTGKLGAVRTARVIERR